MLNKILTINTSFMAALLFGFSLILRLSLLSKGPFHPDSIGLAINSEQAFLTGHLEPFLYHGYTLNVILGAFFVGLVRLFGNSDPVLAANFMSAFFGALCIPALYLFTLRILNQRSAFFSSVLFSCSPLFLSVSTYGTNHPPALFLLLLGLIFLFDYKKTHRPLFLLAASMAFGLLGSCRMQDLFLMIIPITFFYFGRLPAVNDTPAPPSRIPLRRGRFLFALGLAVAIMLAIQSPFIAQGGIKNYFDAIEKVYKTAYHLTYTRPVFSNLAFSNSLIIIQQELLFVGITLTLGGFILLARQQRQILFFLAAWILCAFLPYGTILIMTPRYLILTLLPFFIAIGFLLSVLISYKKTWIQAIALTCFLLITFLGLVKIIPVLAFRHQHAVMPDYARWVASVTEPDATIIAADELGFIRYYGKRQVYAWPVYPHTRPANLNDFQSWLNAKLNQNEPVYLVGAENADWAGNKFLNQTLTANYRLSSAGESLFEDWHHSNTSLRVFTAELFKIEPRQ